MDRHILKISSVLVILCLLLPSVSMMLPTDSADGEIVGDQGSDDESIGNEINSERRLVVAAAPDEQYYLPGEKFAPKGLSISLINKDGSVDTAHGFTWEEKTFSKGDTGIKISYDGLSVTVDIYVLDSVEVTKQPIVNVYVPGESFDSRGMEITMTYSGNKTVVVSDFTESEFTLPTEAFTEESTIYEITYDTSATEKGKLQIPIKMATVEYTSDELSYGADPESPDTYYTLKGKTYTDADNGTNYIVLTQVSPSTVEGHGFAGNIKIPDSFVIDEKRYYVFKIADTKDTDVTWDKIWSKAEGYSLKFYGNLSSYKYLQLNASESATISINTGVSEDGKAYTEITFSKKPTKTTNYVLTSISDGFAGSVYNYNKLSINTGNKASGTSVESEQLPLKNIYFNTTKMVKIPDSCFIMPTLASVTLPQGLKIIGSSAFSGSSLATVTIPASVQYIGDKSFQSCASLATLQFSETGENSSLKQIGSSAFSGTAIVDVMIPDSVSKIGDNAFNIGTMKTIQMPKSLSIISSTMIGSMASDLELKYHMASVLDTKNLFKNVTKLTIVDYDENIEMPDLSKFTNLNTLNIEGFTTGDSNIIYRDSDKTSLFWAPRVGSTVTIPSSVTTIEKNAFKGWTALTTVVFNGSSNLKTIGESAFSGCTGLTTIDLGSLSKLETIGDSAFFKCTSLTSVTIPSSVITIGDTAFSTKEQYSLDGDNTLSGLATLTFAETSKCTSIGAFAFGYTNIKSVSIPASVVTIGTGAFYVNTLTSLTFGSESKLTTIGSYAFICKNTDIIIPKSVTEIGSGAFGAVMGNKYTTYSNKVTFENGSTIHHENVRPSWGVSELVIPDSLSDEDAAYIAAKFYTSDGHTRSIITTTKGFILMKSTSNSGDETGIHLTGFAGNIPSEGIIIPKDVEYIDNLAFNNHRELTKVTFEEGSQLKSICGFGQTGIKSITIPASVIKLGNGAFHNSYLETVTFEEGSQLTTIENSVFGTTPLEAITIPKTVTELGDTVFNNCQLMTSIVFEEGCSIDSVGERAFFRIDATEVAIPKTVKSIGKEAFAQCAYLEKVTFANGSELESIGEGAFKRCISLTDIVLPDTVTTISAEAFAGCKSLSEIAIPASVTEIGYKISYNIITEVYTWSFAFEGCSSLRGISIADANSTYVCENGLLMDPERETILFAFDGIKDLVIPSTVKGLLTDADAGVAPLFNGHESLESVDFSSASEFTEINDGMFSDCGNLDTVVLSEDLTKIGSNAFSGTYVTKIGLPGSTENVIPGNIKEIGSNAFSGSVLDGPISFAEGVESIGNSAFSGTAITSVSIPATMTAIEQDAFTGCVSLSAFTVSGTSSVFYEMDGALVKTDGANNTLYICPPTKTYLNVDDRITKFYGTGNGITVFDECELLEAIFVDADNAAFSSSVSSDNEDGTVTTAGLLLSKDGTKLMYVPKAITTVVLPAGITEIQTNAFVRGSVSLVMFNGGSVNIKNKAFTDCTNLRKVFFNSTGTITIGETAFNGCSKLQIAAFSSESASVGSNAFTNSGLSGDLIIKSGTVTLDSNSLSRCGFRTATIESNSSIDVALDPGSVTVFNLSKAPGNNLQNKIVTNNNDVQTYLNNPSENENLKNMKHVSLYSSGDWSKSSISCDLSGYYELDQNYSVRYSSVENCAYPVFVTSDLDGVVVSQTSTSEGSVTLSVTTAAGHTQYDIDVYYSINNSDPAEATYSDGYVISGLDSSSKISLTISESSSDETYGVSFITSGGSSVEGFRISEGRTILVYQISVEPVRDLYTFGGWYTNAGCTTQYVFGTQVNGDVVFYAKWTKNAGPTVTIDDTDGNIKATCSDREVTSGSVLSSGSVVKFEYTESPGHEFRNWIINGIMGSEEKVMEMTVTADTTVAANVVIYSPSNSLTSVIDIGALAEGQDVTLLWNIKANVDKTMGNWSGFPSTPLIVGDSVYIRQLDKIYKIDINTGAMGSKTAESTTVSNYYHYLSYGGGLIIDQVSSTVYDLDLNKVCDLPRYYGAVFYNDGNYYGVSGGAIFKFSIDESSKTITECSDGEWENGVDVDWFSIYGTYSSPVFVDGYMYFIEVDDNARAVSSVSLDDGTKNTVELERLSGHMLDDGWLTYYDGHLYLTSYTKGLFGAVSANGNGYITVMAIDKGAFTYTSFFDTGFNTIHSAFVAYNDRGYLLTGTNFIVYSITKDTDGIVMLDKLYTESTTFTHGSIVLNTAYATEENHNTVYIYHLAYGMSEQAIYVHTDSETKTERGVYYATSPAGTGNYGSQGIRVGQDGQMIWYTDTGTLFCYGVADNFPYYYLIQDGGETIVIEGSGSDQREGLENALQSAGMSYDISFRGILNGIDGKTGWSIFYYDPVDGTYKSGSLYDSSISSYHTYLISMDVSDYRDIDIFDEGLFLPNQNGIESYSLDAISKSISSFVGKMFSDYAQYYVTYDMNGGSGYIEPVAYSQGESFEIPIYSGTREGYTFVGWDDGSKVYKSTSEDKETYIMGRTNVVFTAVWSSEVRPVTSVEFEESNVSLHVGDVKMLNVTVLPGNALDKTFTLASSDDTVVEVDDTGKITAIKIGTATITATTTDGHKTALCTVVVTGVPVTSVTLSSTSLTMDVGDTVTLTAEVNSGATDTSISWTSVNQSVAYIDADGKITALSAGVSIITAESSNGIKETCTVTVKAAEVKTEKTPVTGVTVSPSFTELNVGDTVKLTATVLPVKADNKSVSWESSNTSVVTVSNGRVTAIAPGSATIIVTTADGGKTASCTVTVNAGVKNIELSSSNGVLSVGESLSLTIMGGSSAGAVWSSSNTSVATVSNGKVTAIAPGSATITATIEKISVKCMITVAVLEGKTMTITPIVSDSGDTASVKISSSTMQKLSLQESEVKVESAIGTLTLSDDVTSSLSKLNGDLDLSIEIVDVDSLPATQKNIAENSVVISLSAMVNGNSIHNLGGKVTVSIPYILKSGEDPSNIRIYYLSDSGSIIPISCEYDKTTMSVIFETDHFSYYAISYEAPETSGGSTTDDTQKILLAGILAALIVLIALFGYFVCVKNKKGEI